MRLLAEEIFVCLDCETTGLESKTDRIIEVAAARFTFSGILESFETLIDPECPIPPSSTKIHNITDEMVKGKPTIKTILPDLLAFVGYTILVGHGINLDVAFILEEAKRNQVPCHLDRSMTIDTLRLARLYGESQVNSLENLRKHFNIEGDGAHRAMSDVAVNIEVFKHLSTRFKTVEQMLERLKSPIALKKMPLGKYKGRLFSEIPVEYLYWAVKQDFDQDLIFSLQNEIKKRRKGNLFHQASNPFSSL
jgi:DNA polymerase III subunit epsilon